MRIAMAMLLIGLLLFCSATGCGTMANCTGREGWMMPPVYACPSRAPYPFGGVANTGKGAAEVAGSNRNVGGAVLAAMILVDAPLSLAGDVVTLPWTTFEYTREKISPTNRYRTPVWNADKNEAEYVNDDERSE